MTIQGCPGERQKPTEMRKGLMGWARKYGLGLCPHCGKWVTLHKDKTMVFHGGYRVEDGARLS